MIGEEVKIHLYNNDGTKLIAEVPVEAKDLPPMVYKYVGIEYKFYVRGSARNSTTYYEGAALHVANAIEEPLTKNPTSTKM